MKVLYSWLKEYLDFPYTPDELNDILTMLGLEVGKVERVGGIPGDLEGVVVGHVLEAVQHPNADRLRVTKVDIGQDEPLSIVCGAPNVAAGQKVPVATIGTMLYPFGKGEEGAFKIKKGKIRGEVSMGMICAEDELGIGAGHDGIMVLEQGLTPGTPFKDVVELGEDYVLEIELTPNRIDGASHFGAARDIAAYMRTKPTLPPISIDKNSLTEPNPIPVVIGSPERCARYTSMYIKGISVKESPEWLQDRLVAIGLRPINNVVDITNYVLHELGHPMHAFDADQIAGGEIHVKTLDKETAFTTLDEVERKIQPDVDLMICDTEKGLCIAGTMGGTNSGVTEKTTNVFLESAYFDAGSVRKTAKRHGISSDSSFRFERGADPNMTETALLRAASLIIELAGGEPSQVSDIKLREFPHFDVDLSVKKTERLIGKSIGRETIIDILKALEIEVEEDGDILHLKVPPYRVDVQRDVDVIEDILRVYNYNNVEIPEAYSGTLAFRPYRNVHEVQERFANYLSANGFYEILNNSLVSKELGDEKAIDIVNPLSEDLGIMRQSMLPGMLETIRHNQNRQQEGLAIYEFGKTYGKENGEYAEQKWLAMSLTGERHPMHWQAKMPKVEFSDLMREIQRLQQWFGFEGKLSETEHPELDFGLELKGHGKKVLTAGRVKAEWAEKYSLRNEVFYLLADWDVLLDIYFSGAPKYKPIPVYPAIRRDISMLINDGATFADIEATVSKANPKLIRSIELHDIYMGDKIAKGKKSYLISIELRDDNKTLADKAAEKVVARAYQLLEKELGAEIRK